MLLITIPDNHKLMKTDLVKGIQRELGNRATDGQSLLSKEASKRKSAVST